MDSNLFSRGPQVLFGLRWSCLLDTLIFAIPGTRLVLAGKILLKNSRNVESRLNTGGIPDLRIYNRFLVNIQLPMVLFALELP